MYYLVKRNAYSFDFLIITEDSNKGNNNEYDLFQKILIVFKDEDDANGFVSTKFIIGQEISVYKGFIIDQSDNLEELKERAILELL